MGNLGNRTGVLIAGPRLCSVASIRLATNDSLPSFSRLCSHRKDALTDRQGLEASAIAQCAMSEVGLPPGPPGHLRKSYVGTSHLALIARSTILAHPLLRILYVLYEATSLCAIRVPFWFFQYLIPHFRPKGDRRGVFTLVWIRIIQRFLAVGVIARITPTIFHTPPRFFLWNSAFVYVPVLPDKYACRSIVYHQ